MRHLLDERRQHLIHELAIAQDDLLDPARADQMHEVARHISGSDRARENVHVMRELEDPGAELDAFGDLAERADDRDTVAGHRIELDHMHETCARIGRERARECGQECPEERTDIRSAEIEPGHDKHDLLVGVRQRVLERRLPGHSLEVGALQRVAVRKVGLKRGVTPLDVRLERIEPVDEGVAPSLGAKRGGVDTVPIRGREESVLMQTAWPCSHRD